MPSTEIHTFKAHSLFIDERLVQRVIGYPKAHQASAPVAEAMPRLIRTARELAVPVALHGIWDLQSVSPDVVSIAGGPSFHGTRVATAMQSADGALLFVLSLGERLCDFTKDLAAKDPFEGFLLDAIASVMVESLADAFQKKMEARLKNMGLWSGLRFSPGYCDWPVVENGPLLLFIGSGKIRVSLTGGGMMVPDKTISGMIGFGPDKEKVRINPCLTCDRSDCNHRRDLAMS